MRGFHWTRADLAVPNLSSALEGLRILHLADVHFNSRWTASHDELAAKIEQEKPDLILLTGDLVENRTYYVPNLPHIRRLASHLAAPLGCFSILGNHDGDLLGPYLRDTPITVIDNDSRRLPVGDAAIELIGLPGVHRGDLSPDVLAAFPPKSPGSLRIVLSHYPDHVRKVSTLHADIMLTGHTHGGQICLPGGVPIVRHDSLPRRYCKGIHCVNDLWLVVSRGFGFAGGVNVRMFCPAEVIVLTFRSDQSNE
ncbi:hypothetical protein BH10PLA1_BH10PLA1_13990 [soil metagenome]